MDKKLKTTLCTIVAGVMLSVPLPSCKTNYVPEYDYKCKVENEPYHIFQNNCFDKSIKYHQRLKKKGYVSKVVIGDVDDSSLHAWVEVYDTHTDVWYLIDPTWTGKENGWERDLMTNYHTLYECASDITDKSQQKEKCLPVKSKGRIE